MDIIDVLSRLTSSVGVSGNEYDASATASEILSDYAEVNVDSFGNMKIKRFREDSKIKYHCCESSLDSFLELDFPSSLSTVFRPTAYRGFPRVSVLHVIDDPTA